MAHHIFVVAHTDDEVLACGGTIRRLAREGHQITVVYCAEKVVNHVIDHEVRASRRKSVEKVKSILGITDVVFSGESDENLFGPAFVKIVDVVEGVIAKDPLRDQIVWTHWAQDFNQDHRAVSEAVEIACRRMNHVRALRHFETPSSSENSPRAFQPNLFFELTTEDMEAKFTSLLAYKEELSSHRNVSHIFTYAAFRGLAVQRSLVEAFQIIREIY